MTEPTPRIVMAFGTFDIFHAGHEYYLKQAKALGDFLIVVIARDRTVQQIKGEKPQQNEKERAKTVSQTGIPNKVVLGNHGDKYKVLKKHRPAIIALGYDQFVFTHKLKKTLIDLNLDAEIHRLPAYFPQIYKSSLLKQQINYQEETQLTYEPTK